MNHAQIAAELMNSWPETRPEPSLSRITAFCDLIGNPQHSVPTITVTGTNGKGSTAIMIDALLRSLGLRTGRMSSPHLADITERICIDGEPISFDDFDNLVAEHRPFIEMVDEMRLDGVAMTFFEVMTGLAFAGFAAAPVDVMILEVGMGGSWDATNIADADVAVITPIDLDHTHILGDTVAAIATEKAGIIKAGATAVIAEQLVAAAEVIAAKCRQVGAKPWVAGRDFGLIDRKLAVGGQLLRLQSPSGIMGDLYLPLFGSHMAENAALALAAVSALFGGKDLEPNVIADGFAAVSAPARLEIMRRSPTVVLDTAHNPHGVAATLAAVRESFDFEPLIGVVAMMSDKDIDGVLELLSAECAFLVVTQISTSTRGLASEVLTEKAISIMGPERVRRTQNISDAIEVAVGLADDATGAAGVLFIGSVIAAGEARTLLGSDSNDTVTG